MAETNRSRGSRILVVDDELGIRQGVQRALRSEGHVVDTAEDLAGGRKLLQREQYDLVLLDVMMPDGSGIDLIEPAHERDPDTVCIIVTGYATVELAVSAVKRGAYDFISKPFTVEQLLVSVNQGLERRALTLESKRLASVEERAEQLFRDKEELERLDTVKSQLMLQVAHELRAPTAAVQSYVNLILAGYVAESELRPTLLRIQERLQQTLDLVADLLDLARLKQSRERINSEATAQPAAAVLREVVALLNPQSVHKEQKLSVDIRSDPVIAALPNHLRQIWMNLISNAIKYTPHGGLISVTLDEANGELGVPGPCLVGTVEDSGIGIAAHDLPSLFGEFFRTDEAKATGEVGTGLGLSIVKQIVDSYGGRIQVKSEPGEGTRFTFALPLNRREAAPHDQGEPPRPA
ncbi:MAG TPA: ATP-binding protein [Anaerolineae bacterium]|nr:ATP-binding protein [Anaerolineae bacterium]